MSDSRKIVHINTHDAVGGAAKVAWRLAEAQREAGHDAGMMVGHRISRAGSVHVFPKSPDPYLMGKCRNRGLLYYELQGSHQLVFHDEIRAADLLHLHNLHGDYFNPFSLPALTRSTPTVWTLHDMQAITGHCAHAFDCMRWRNGCKRCPRLDIEPAISLDVADRLWLDKAFIYRHLNAHVVTPSHWLEKKVASSNLRHLPRSVIPNGIDTLRFKPKDPRRARAEFGIPAERFVVGAVGHGGTLTNPWKGGHYTHQVLKGLWERHPELIFVNIGSDAHSEDPRIVNVPHIQDEAALCRVYSAMDAFLYTPVADNCPLVIIEALSCGIPPVTFGTGGIPEMIEDGVTGRVVPTGDVASMVAVVSHLAGHPDACRTLSGNARKTAVARFDHSRIVSLYAALYEKIMKRHAEVMRRTPILMLESVPEIVRTEAFVRMSRETETSGSGGGDRTAAVGGSTTAARVRDVSADVDRHLLPSVFQTFTFSQYWHFGLFEEACRLVYGGDVSPDDCDLKAYQDLLVCTFIRSVLPPGARILEVGGGDSRVIDALGGEYEFWNLDKFEGVGNGPVGATSQNARWVNDYLGSFSAELPDGYFDAVISISVMEHIAEDDNVRDRICDDLDRVLKPGGWSLHLFDVILKADGVWANGLLHHFFQRYRTVNAYVPLEAVPKALGAYTMSRQAYERLWQPVTKTSYDAFGRPMSYQVLWQKPAVASTTPPDRSEDALASTRHFRLLAKMVKANRYCREHLPRISIVTPSLNQGAFLSVCMDSIIDQDYPHLEYIVMDGGSWDDSSAIIQQRATHLAHWQSRPDGGQYAAIAEGLQKCTGDIMGWLNADDKLHEDSLFITALVFMGWPHARWITGRPTVWDADGRLSDILNPLSKWCRHDYLSGRYGPPHIQQESTFWRRALWEQAGGVMDTALKFAGDLELWSRFFRTDALYSVDALLGGFRSHPDQKTARYMPAYNAEADTVIARERSFPCATDTEPAPTPIRLISQVAPEDAVARKTPGDSVTAPARSYPRAAVDTLRARCLAQLVKQPFDTEVLRTWSSLADGSQEKEIVASVPSAPGDYWVTAIVSTYRSEAFMVECLENLLSQSIGARLEIVVVDADSPEDERDIVLRYRARHPNIAYLRTRARIGVYAAWNIAVRAARGRFLFSMSTNDHLHVDACRIMAGELEAHSDVAMVYGDTYLTRHPHETFGANQHYDAYRWPEYRYEDLLNECMIGPHPMWRRSVHDAVGYFDERFLADGDQEFWLRMGERFMCRHIEGFTGLQWISPDALSQKGQIPILEARFIHRWYRERYQRRKQLMRPRCSIIIPVFNQVEMTHRCLERIREHTPEELAEIIVVDNGSTDGTSDLLASQGHRLRVITNDVNQGFAKACNQGANAARSGYLLFLNNDTEPEAGWLSALLEVLDTDSRVVAVGGKLVFPNGTIQHAGVAVSQNLAESLPVAPWHPFYGKPAAHPAASEPRVYQALTAACLMVRRERFDAVGGFDESFWNGYEDVDLCLKLGAVGGVLVYQPKCRVIHHESQSGPERHVRTDSNLRLLQGKWANRFTPDTIIEADGTTRSATGSPIRVYVPPRNTDRRPYRIGIVTLDEPTFACPQIRLIQPLRELQRHWPIDWAPLKIPSAKASLRETWPQLDLIIVQRNAAKALPYHRLAEDLGPNRPAIVYEFDDAFISLKPDHPAHDYYQRIAPDIETYIKKADAVIVSTLQVKAAYRHLRSDIAVVPNCLPDAVWSFQHAPQSAGSGKTRILFAGTEGHEPDLSIIEASLEQILKEFGDSVELLLWGNRSPRLEALENVRQVAPFRTDYAEYSQLLAALRPELAVVPLADTPFNRAKSPIKWLEYGACEIAGVFSDLPPYQRVVNQLENGVLVKNEGAAWTNALRMLLSSPETRQRIAQAARRDVWRHHALSDNLHHWASLLLPVHLERTPQTPRVSVVIPVFNQLAYTRRCLAALAENTPAHLCETIIVDNGSTDGTGAYLSTIESSSITVISNGENQGFARACNQGAVAAVGDAVLFLNNDVEVRPGWLPPLIHCLDTDPSVGAVGSKLLYPDGTIQHAGVILVDNRRTGDPLQAMHRCAGSSGNAPEVNHAKTFKALSAACLLVRKDAFNAVGGFDEAYWNGYEDVDLCLSLGAAGWRLFYQPESQAIHYESKSGPERFRRAAENIQRLHQRWLGKVSPDTIIDAEGRMKAAGISTDSSLTSIIVLTFNQLHLTRQCVESVLAHTRSPFELIIVDNGSTDGTVAYANALTLTPSAAMHIRVIANAENRGYAAGNNQGMAAARGDFILLLNNDTVVTPGWLEPLLRLAQHRPDIGLVGPVSNQVAGPQRLAAVDYDIDSLEGLNDFGTKIAHQSLPAQRAGRVVGFCMMFAREVMLRIGGLDERFGTGNFEDDDYCLRAALAGYQSWIARDSFVHHAGGATFAAGDNDRHQRLLKNWKIFKVKWNLPKELPYGTYDISSILKRNFDPEVHYEPLSAAMTGENRAKRKRTVNPMLLPIEKTETTPWNTSDVITQADHSPNGIDYQRALRHLHRGDTAAAVDILEQAALRYPADKDLLKTLADVYYSQQHRVEDAMKLYVKILALDPFEVGTLMMMGHICVSVERFEDAQHFYGRVLETEPWHDEARKYVEAIRRHEQRSVPEKETPPGGENKPAEMPSGDDMLKPVETMIENERFDAAISALNQIVETHPDHAEAHSRLGELLQTVGDAETAQQQFETAARRAPEDQQIQKQLADFYYTVQGRTEDALRIYDALADANPADVDVHMLAGHLNVALERFDAAEARYREVLRAEPWHADAGRYLDAVERHRAETAPRLTEDPDALYQKALGMAEAGDAAGAVTALESLVAAHPDHAAAHNDLGVLYYRQDDMDRCESHYAQAMALEPDNTVYQKNLADFYAVAANRYDEALQIYVALLAKDPHDVEALMGTGHICHLLERSDDAAHFFARVLEAEPWHEDARNCLDAIGQQRTAAAG